MLGNDIALACYIFDTHQPIVIYFVDNKVIIISLLVIFVKHQLVSKINAVDASSGTAKRGSTNPETCSYYNTS